MGKNGQRVSGSEKRMDKIGKVCLDLEKGWTKWAKYVWIWTKWAKAVWILNKDGKGKKKWAKVVSIWKKDGNKGAKPVWI